MVSLLKNPVGPYAHYSVHALTDEAGAVVEGYMYDAYGRQTVFTDAGSDATWFSSDDTFAADGSSAIANEYMYTGRRWNEEGGNYYFRNRYYDSALGRFIGRDPIGYVDGMSLYASYFAVNAVDPTGLDGDPITSSIKACLKHASKKMRCRCLRSFKGHPSLGHDHKLLLRMLLSEHCSKTRIPPEWPREKEYEDDPPEDPADDPEYEPDPGEPGKKYIVRQCWYDCECDSDKFWNESFMMYSSEGCPEEYVSIKEECDERTVSLPCGTTHSWRPTPRCRLSHANQITE